MAISPEPQTTRFTPGPWTVEPSDSGDSSVGLAPTPPIVFTTIPNREDRSIDIAVVGSTIYDNSEHGDSLSWGDPDANARLIACAPELYEALTECSFRLAALVAASGDFSDINAKALDQAAALLAKVEGR